MTSWATITLTINRDSNQFVSPPTGLTIDSGLDEMAWLDDDETRLFALSYGRYQRERFTKHAKNFDSSWYNGVEKVAITEAENTGDEATVYIYVPKQNSVEERGVRLDGVYYAGHLSGKIWPDEELDGLKQKVEAAHDIRPRIKPLDTTVPPDAFLVK